MLTKWAVSFLKSEKAMQKLDGWDGHGIKFIYLLPIIVNVSFHVNSYLIADPKLEIGSYNAHHFYFMCVHICLKDKIHLFISLIGYNLPGYHFCYLAKLGCVQHAIKIQ